jgi:hypothetical protein
LFILGNGFFSARLFVEVRLGEGERTLSSSPLPFWSEGSFSSARRLNSSLGAQNGQKEKKDAWTDRPEGSFSGDGCPFFCRLAEKRSETLLAFSSLNKTGLVLRQ